MAKIRSRSRRAPRPSKATDPGDPVLQGGYIERVNGRHYLFTTDGAVILRFPIDAASQVPSTRGVSPGYIPREALLHIERDRASFSGDERELRVGSTFSQREGGGKIRDGEPRVIYSRAEPVWDLERKRHFPKIAKLWPRRAREKVVIGIDTMLLRRLAMAMGEDVVRLEVGLDSELPSELFVTSPGSVDGIAAILEQPSVNRND